MIDLYAVLDVPQDATKDQIKRAYRRKAKSTHPDAGGSKEAFADLAMAYGVLFDPERRARYDATGEYEERSALNGDAQIFACINAVLADVLGHDQDYLDHDLVGIIRETLNNQIKALKSRLVKIETANERAKRMQGRFTRDQDEEDNLLERMVAWHLANSIKAAQQVKAEIELRLKASRSLDHYRFSPEASAGVNPFTFMWGVRVGDP